jgi:hypothetical protein
MIPLWLCRTLFTVGAAVNKTASHTKVIAGTLGRHAHRPIHRIAKAITWKRAGWVCVLVAGGAGMTGIPMLWPHERPSEAQPGGTGPLAHFYPPEAFAEQPREFFTLPPAPPLVEFPVIGPPVPQVGFPPETQPVPEPGTLAMLATAVAVLALIRGGRNG